MTLRNGLVAIAALTALSSGCIIYETDPDDGRKCGADCLAAHEDDTGVDLKDPEPEPNPKLYLTVDAAEQGATLFTSIETVDDFDLTRITDVQFEQDVDVLDTIVRMEEVLLLIDVDPEAEPGAIGIFVKFDEGDAMMLDLPFTILELDADDDADDASHEDTGDCP